MVGLFLCLLIPFLTDSQVGVGSSANYAGLVTIVISVLVTTPPMIMLMVAGWAMQRVRFYGLAIAASIIALIPFHTGFIIGLPIGIWSLVVLARPEIKEAFARRH